MPNHRRTHTSRHENKRLANKRARAAENDALRGGPPKVVRNDWPTHPVQPPLLDEGERYRKASKRKRPPKERCPINRKHECLTEEREVERYSYWNGWTKQVRRFKMCVHCGKEWIYGHTYRGRSGWKALDKVDRIWYSL